MVSEKGRCSATMSALRNIRTPSQSLSRVTGRYGRSKPWTPPNWSPRGLRFGTNSSNFLRSQPGKTRGPGPGSRRVQRIARRPPEGWHKFDLQVQRPVSARHKLIDLDGREMPPAGGFVFCCFVLFCVFCFAEKMCHLRGAELVSTSAGLTSVTQGQALLLAGAIGRSPGVG